MFPTRNCRNIRKITYDRGYESSQTRIDEYIFRARNLIAIANHEFEFYPDENTAFMFLQQYKRSRELEESYGDAAVFITDELRQLMKDYNEATAALAKELLAQQNQGSVEYLLCLFYANDFESFFTLLWSRDGSTSLLHKIWWEYRTSIEWEFEVQAKLCTGLWFPLGANSVMGVHPHFGYAFGIRAWIFQIDFSGIVRFCDTADEYTAYHSGMLYDTRSFFGIYVGADISIDLFRIGKNELIGIIGLGYDALVVLNRDDHGGYVYIDNRYTFLGHQNENGTDLSGDAVSTLIGIGTTLHKEKYNKLKALYVY